MDLFSGPGFTVVVAVCAFTKWPEAEQLANKEARTVARWFHCTITCRYGTPVVVRTDQGKEFAGAFSRYLSRMVIQHAMISVVHPRANGLVERYNGVIRAGLRKM